MSLESELKMLPREKILPEDVLKLLKQNGYVIQGELKIKPQEDSYYDNPEQNLNKSGSSFRIRRKNDGAVVTYKTPINSREGFKQREEMEVQIPSFYIKEDGSIDINDAISILKNQYPNAVVPENLQLAVKVKNNRNKVNIKSPEGTVIELAFDDLNITDEHDSHFKMKNEIESEILSGNPKELNRIRRIIGRKFDVQDNSLSKYSRAMKEMKEQKSNLSLEEVTTCAILSHVIDTKEFEQLKKKGQILYDYRIDFPKQLELDNFRDPQYLMRKISDMKRQKDYQPGRINNLEDMFLCYFSDMDYQDIEYKLVDFLNRNYYSEEAPTTNRMLHSQQVMLVSGLIAKSKAIPENEQNRLLCMTSGLVHDIGHVPGAHATERILAKYDGFFSHEINGKNVLENIVQRNEQSIKDAIKEHYAETGENFEDEEIEKSVNKVKEQIEKSIEAHSRTNSEQRGAGTVVQLPREADKICYSVSDIVDIIKIRNRKGLEPVKFFPEKWKGKVEEKLGKGYKEDEIKAKIEAMEKFIKINNYGEIVTNIANTVRRNEADSKVYYDVEQDTWDIMNKMIEYVADLRKEGQVTSREDAIEKASELFIVRTFNEALKRNNGNMESAWNSTLHVVTNSNDLNLLNCVEQIRKMSVENPEILSTAQNKGGMLDNSKLLQLDNSDRQIKILPDGKIQLSDLQLYLGTAWNIQKPEEIEDTYFKTREGVSICLRRYLDKNKRQLIVKKSRNKDGVTQVEREKLTYETTMDTPIETLVEEFNKKYGDTSISKSMYPLECIIETKRMNSINNEGIVLRRDISEVMTVDGKKQLPEIIEIDCSDKRKMKDIRKRISNILEEKGIDLKAITTKETKEKMAVKMIEEERKNKEKKKQEEQEER